jgi:T5SS/PEP-CTERM-associated repeat protein
MKPLRSTFPVHFPKITDPQPLLLMAVTWLVLVPITAWATISTSGNVTPPYPGGGLDPWNVGAELAVGLLANGSLTIDGGSDVVSTSGTAGSDATVTGAIVVTGSGSTWSNSEDLFLGVFGAGTLDVLQGARVVNSSASLGHLDGSGTVLVEGAGSEWNSANELIVGNVGDGQLTIRQQGRAISGAARIGLNAAASGTVVVDGPGSDWEIFDSLSLGDVAAGGSATLSLTGAGSRVYVGTAAIIQGAQLPAQQTALVVSELIGLSQLSIYGGNQLHNSGSGYVALGVNQNGAVTINGANSAWNNDGDVTIGAGGNGTLSLVDGGTVSAGGAISIGQYGTVEGNGTVSGNTQNAGTIAPGTSVGRIDVVGGFSQSASGKLQLELAGTTPGQFDQLAVTGLAALDGALEISLDGSFVPQIGDTFDILTASGITGEFTAADLPTLSAGRMWQLRYTSNSAALAVTLAGDYNDNGLVDAADYVLWRNLLGSTVDPRADGDANGVVDAVDYNIWRANFGAVAGSGSGASLSATAVVVPEPASGVFLMTSLGLAVMSRRRRIPTTALQPAPRI